MRGEQDRARLHLITSRRCNNNCLFCVDERSERPHATIHEAEAQLQAHRDLGRVLFTCGEPTLHEELTRMIGRARELGYHEILLVTNARRLAYADYARALVDAGLTGVTVSVHGPDAKTHDRLVRTPGAFDQTWQGLRNLKALRDEGQDLRLTTSSVVQKGNVDRLGDLLDLLDEIAPDTIVLNVVQPVGEAVKHQDAVMLKYHLVAEALRDTLAIPRTAEVVIEGLPWCVAPDLMRYLGQRERIVMRRDEQDKALDRHRGQVRGAPCQTCSCEDECGGVFEAYTDRFGWDEFATIHEED